MERASQLLAPSAEIDLGTLDKQFNVRANDIFVGLHSSRLLEEMARGMPRAMLRFMPEEDDIDDDALRSGRIDLFISASRRLEPEIRVQPLFTTTFVGLARDDHPIFDDDITPERFARWPHIGVSRRGKSAGPIDDALAARGLARQVLLVVPTPYAAIFALQASDLILPLPEHLARGAVRAGRRARRAAGAARNRADHAGVASALPERPRAPVAATCRARAVHRPAGAASGARMTHASYALVECKDVTVPHASLDRRLASSFLMEQAQCMTQPIRRAPSAPPAA